MVDNDNADILNVRGALESIASKLAPTRDRAVLYNTEAVCGIFGWRYRSSST
jgi:hypothetical protein